MNDRGLRAALISTDPVFTAHVRTALMRPDLGVTLALESPVRFAEFDEEHVGALRTLAPELVIIDLEDDPDLGVKFIEFLSGTANQKIIAAQSASPSTSLTSAWRSPPPRCTARPSPMVPSASATYRNRDSRDGDTRGIRPPADTARRALPIPTAAWARVAAPARRPAS